MADWQKAQFPAHVHCFNVGGWKANIKGIQTPRRKVRKKKFPHGNSFQQFMYMKINSITLRAAE